MIHVRRASFATFAAFLALALSAHGETTPAAFYPEKLVAIDRAIDEAIATSKIVGGCVWVERNGVAYHKAYGRRALSPVEPMAEDTIFDLASITKVVATATAAMQCIERGLFALDDPVAKHLPAFTGEGREKITIRHLLLHTSGLRVNLDPKTNPYRDRDTAVALICREKPATEPGSAFSYSSVGSMLLGAVIEQVTGKPLDQFCAAEIFRPLGMSDTVCRPSGQLLGRVAPTSAPARGLVDDTAARTMGGVAGHASLFSTTADLARFARMMLNRGELDGVRVLRADTVKLMTSVQSPADLRSPAAANLPVRRGLGWDIDSPYRTPPHPYSNQRGSLFPVGGFGHAGWTGQSLWIDPFSQTFVIFLCNRYQPGAPESPGAVYELHRQISTIAAEAVKDFDFRNVADRLPAATREPSTK